MLDELRALAVFSRTAELGSFRAASTALGLSPSVVSHHVSRLEQRLGVPLLYRTTRRLSLTPEGERLFEETRRMLDAAERGLDALQARDEGPTGELRMTVPGFLDATPLHAHLADFLSANPRVRLTVVSSDERRDLVAEGFDLALRAGALPDSGLKRRRVANMRRVLVGAPGYVRARPAPTRAADLADWDFVRLSTRPAEIVAGPPGGALERVRVRARAAASSAAAVLTLVRAGAGIAALPEVMSREALRDGALVEVPPGWSLEVLGVFLVWPDGARRRNLTARLVDFLAPRVLRLFEEGLAPPKAPRRGRVATKG